jgi:hypothetical protein|nr:MAG TPA: hypothetical protein [Crassvirales sp.]
MKIVNSIMPMSDIEALAANGQKLRVAVTKTSAQGKSAQSATPNLMSFSTDENSIWFNGKKYGVHLFKDSIYTLSTSSSHQDIVNALNGLDSSNIKSFVDTGVIGVFRLNESPDYYQGIVILGYKEEEPIHMYLYITDNYYNTKYILINISTPTKYVVEAVEDSSLLREADVANSLTLTSTTTPLSAAMGKKLNDEKLAKTDVVNNLTTTDTSKALSAAQGKALNDKFNGNKININFSATLNSTDNATIKGYMGNIDGTTLVSKLTYGANLVDSSSDDWVITLQEVSATKVVFVGLKLQSFSIATKTITVTISGSNYTNMAVIAADRYVPNVVNNLTSFDTANALSAAQGKALNDKISALGSVYRIKGSKTDISEVLALTGAKVGDAWNVTNAFTLGGKPYPANTNVVCITATSTSDHDENNWDPIGGTVDLSLYAKKSDISYTTDLPDSLVVPQTIGGINKGTKVSDLEGSTISQMFDNLLFPEVQPTIQAPSATIHFKDTFSSNGVYEVGTTAPIAANFNTSFNRGTCTVVGQADKNRAGALDSGNSFIYYGGNTSTKALPAKVTLGTMQYNYHAAYAQGDTLVTSKGNKASAIPNPLLAGSVDSSNLTIFGTYPYYCNGQSASSSSGDSNFPTSATPNTKLPLYKWTDTLVGAKFASEAATGTRMQFMYSNRKKVTKVEFYNSISGKWETFDTSNYNANSGIKTYSVQGTNETYNILTTTGPLSGSVQYRFTMTNA